ncbi:MAG: hypothetical protein ACFFEJ_13705 [Candidatus Thorarchaeota archaeon]
MCGIIGVIAGKESNLSYSVFRKIVESLFKLSESRGKESAGFSLLKDNAIHVYKVPIPATRMLKTKTCKTLLDANLDSKKQISSPISLIGHSRLVTDGSQNKHENNQPVVKSGIVGVHNGIIVNSSSLWDKYPSLSREYDIDTEILLDLTRYYFSQSNSLEGALKQAMTIIKGNASIILQFEDLDSIAVATNNGSLYTFDTEGLGIFIYASERYILKQIQNNRMLKDIFGTCKIRRIMPYSGEIISLKNLSRNGFAINDSVPLASDIELARANRSIIDNIPDERIVSSEYEYGIVHCKSVIDNPSLLLYPREKLDLLQRCTKCILPETFPFIEFDEEGVCNYCKSYNPIKLKGHDMLDKVTKKFRTESDEQDCIVMFSGGRDSTYGVHYITEVLGMNPITYTYDWGMVTDLARRNIARVCGKLGLEHILVSADIPKKRYNIRKNVEAWLSKPDLGTIPLFMAGDKQYFYYANKLMGQTGIKLAFLSANPYERTHFKTAFCGIPPSTESGKDLSSFSKKVMLASYYAKSFIRNPRYLNSTILDTLFGFFSFYGIPHNYIRLYDFIEWDEELVTKTLIDEYDWEIASDTSLTWRIGDGTASFYNYIYLSMAGFTENETFRSNQIREGILTREKGLEMSMSENTPRYEGIKWYLDAIGLGNSFNQVISRINLAPKLY